MLVHGFREVVAGRRRPVVATVGVFDGVHRGHRKILALVKRKAGARGISVAVTFEKHPLSIISPSAAPKCITTLAQRLRRLASFGFDRILVVRFTRSFARLSAVDFINRILVDKLHVKELVVGRGWRFGRARQGTPALLRRAGAGAGFCTKFVAPVAFGRSTVSSTRVRRLVAAGRMVHAARLLGRYYSVDGTRVRGRRIGRKIGFPTVNILPANQLLPPFGVYAVRIPSLRAAGVANLGVKPTVARGLRRPLLEIHLFRTPPARLPRIWEVELVAFLRRERKFRSLIGLKRQIGRDVRAAGRAMASAGRGREPN